MYKPQGSVRFLLLSSTVTASPLLSSFAIAIACMIARLRLQIVEKAVWESKYCSLYAELCHRFALQADIDAGDAQQPQSQQPRAPDDADESARPENAARNTYLAVLSVRDARSFLLVVSISAASICAALTVRSLFDI